MTHRSRNLWSKLDDERKRLVQVERTTCTKTGQRELFRELQWLNTAGVKAVWYDGKAVQLSHS